MPEPRRHWDDLTEDERERITRMLKPDPDDNLDDLLARLDRARQIIEGESRAV